MRLDDQGAIQIVEAVLVAVLILAGILFMTLVTRPPLPQGADATGLGTVADDTARLLAGHQVTDPINASRELNVTDWVDAIVRGDNTSTRGADVEAEIQDYLHTVTPLGMRAAIFLDNGHGAMPLVPSTGISNPRSSAVGQAFIVPNWTAFADEPLTDLCTPAPCAPGQQLDAPITCIHGPTGNVTAPGTQDWDALWDAGDTVPQWAPLGVWGVGCGTPTTFFLVQSPANAVSPTDRPAYALRVVVWRGA